MGRGRVVMARNPRKTLPKTNKWKELYRGVGDSLFIEWIRFRLQNTIPCVPSFPVNKMVARLVIGGVL